MEKTNSATADSLVSVSSVALGGACSGGGEIPLGTPVEFDPTRPMGVFTLCRLAMLRLPVSPLEKVVLEAILLADETGIGRRGSYAELGRMVGRCEHSAKQAVASLRKAGLVTTARSGVEGAGISFSAYPLVVWAAGLLQRLCHPGKAPESAVSETAVSVHENEETVHESGFSVSKKPERVSKTRRPRAQALAAKKETQTPAPAAPDGGQPAILGMAAPYEGEFDNSEELADTLRAAGRSEVAGDDTDEISFGSETADTDIGQGVRINPNL